MEKRRLCCALLIAALALPVAANAYTGDLFGLNMRGLAMANAVTALAEGPSAAFYNPALLAGASGVQVEANYLYSLASFRLKLKDAAGVQLDPSGDLKDAQATPAIQYLGTGVSGRIGDYVGLGMYMNLPITGLPRHRFFAPQTPYWLKYDTSVQGFQLYPGVSVRIIPNLMLGLAASIVLDAGGDERIAFPLDADRTGSLTGTSKWSGGATVIAGVFYRPLEFLQIGFTYKGENFIRDKRDYTLDPIGLPVKLDVIYDYSPQTFSLGIVGTPFEWWRISLDIVYTSWSLYRPPFPKLDPLYDQATTPIDEGNRSTLLTVESKDLNFADTLVARIGLEFRPIREFGITLGYSHEPTPVPDQTGTTNILDADDNVIGLGLGVCVGGKDGDLARIDVAGQFHVIAARSTDKKIEKMDVYYADDPSSNPGYPRVGAEASYFVGGLTAKFRF
jgi:long-chain fatty acid transport protein